MFRNPLCEQMTRQTRPGLTVPKKMDTSGSSLLRVCFSCGAKISFTHWRRSLSSDHPCLDHLRLLWRRDVNPPSRISFTHIVYVKSLFFWLVCMNKQWPLTGCPHYLPKHHKCDAGVRRKHYLPHQPTLSVCSMANYCELFLYISL